MSEDIFNTLENDINNGSNDLDGAIDLEDLQNNNIEELQALSSKIKNTDSETLRKLSLNQAAILSTLQAVSSQNDDIKKRFEEQQDKISFP